MQNQSPQPQEPSGDKTVSCELIIQSDTDGIVEYNCNWISGEEGLIGLASIFYKLLIENFGEEIFKEIKNECVINSNEADYVTVVNLINSQAQKNTKTENGNDVVVPPDQVFNI